MLITHLVGSVAVKSLASLAAFQAQDSINSGNSKLLMLFIGIAAFALLAQAIVVIVIGLGAMKAQKEIMGHIAEIKAKVLPFVDKSHALITELTPQVRDITAKVNTITTHIEAISAIAKDKANEFSPTISAANQTVKEANETVREANQKTRAQVLRVDGMVTSALNATVRLGLAIEHGITRPGRELAGLVAGLKTGFDHLISGARSFGSGALPGSYSAPRSASRTYPRPVQTPAPNETDIGL